MAKMCRQHPKTTAVTVCTHCAAPICQECMVYRDGAVFCGEPCAIARKALGEDLRGKLKDRRGPGFVGLIVKLVVVAAVILYGLKHLGLIPGF